ncbi:MAG: RAD55 family ATPase [Candidatus Saliniplasma sp.]
MKKIPTGVSDLDSIIKGGLPAGSVVLLLTEIGAGGLEYLYTSSAKLLRVKKSPRDVSIILGDECKGSILPGEVYYITFSRSQQDILEEVKISFNQDYYDAIEEDLNFKDFSNSYFRRTMVPNSWTRENHKPSLFGDESDSNILEELVDFLEDNAPGNMVVIDSLTDLLTNTSIENDKLVTVIKGMRRASKKWGGVIYLLLSKGIVDRSTEYLLIDSVDGVMSFEWSKSHHTSKRQRYMFLEKFMSVLPHLKREKIARFTAEVTDFSGYNVVNYEKIR